MNTTDTTADTTADVSGYRAGWEATVKMVEALRLLQGTNNGTPDHPWNAELYRAGMADTDGPIYSDLRSVAVSAVQVILRARGHSRTDRAAAAAVVDDAARPNKALRSAMGRAGVPGFADGSARMPDTTALDAANAPANVTTPTAGGHMPVSYLNTTGAGIRTFIGCTCGDNPGTMPKAGTSLHVWHGRHRRTLGLPPLPSYAVTVYGPQYPAAGQTFEQWRTAHPGRDPFGQRN